MDHRLRVALANKPLAILLVFLVLFRLRRVGTLHKSTKRRVLDRPALPAKSDVSKEEDINNPWTAEESNNVTEVWVPYKRSSRQVRVKHIGGRTFDADAKMFPVAQRGFAHESRALLHVLFPHVNNRAARLIAIHAALLGMRTYLSLVVAELDGRIVRHLMSANGRGFARGLAEWLVLAVPASYTNALIRYFEGKIGLEFRMILVRYVTDLYLGARQEYYKVNHIDGALDGIDHYITSDVTKFCNASAKLYSNLGKPILDLGIFATKLMRNLGSRAAIGIFINYFVTATLLRAVSPAFGRLAARETKLEGDYRSAHARVITNAEEIAFYDGADVENASLRASFRRLQRNATKLIRTRAWYSIVEGYVLKYSWSASGFLFAAVPVFFPDAAMASARAVSAVARGHGVASTLDDQVSMRGHTEQDNMGHFVTNKRIMLSIADAGGRIMYSLKDLAELAGHTQRIYELIAVLHRVRTQNYSRQSIMTRISSSSIANKQEAELVATKETMYEVDEAVKKTKKLEERPQHHDISDEMVREEQAGEFTLADVRGELEIEGDDVQFDQVPVVVPGHGCDLSNGEVLLDPLTFHVKQGEHLLIVGSNGTGKTSIARLAAGLWPVFRGVLKRSPNVAFLPQRPYFPVGSLRDQVIYPQTHFEMQQSGRTDDEVLEILRQVNLAYLLEREGGLKVTKEWKDVLSGGEKQRVLFARVLYARPKFAIIDEGTSAVSADMEGQLFEFCKNAGITLLTITHRISLLKYHDAKLEVGLGDDGFQWSLENSSKHGWQSLDTEIEHLKSFLAEVPKLKKRREEIVQQLSH